MLRQRTMPVLVATFLLFHSSAWANNNYFLPGDAFFHCVLTKADVDDLLKPTRVPRVFKYSFYGAEFQPAFCGYAGYSHATIPQVDERFAANLAAVYEKIRSFHRREWRETDVEGKPVLVEFNPVHVFFYRSDYQFREFGVALRYNENWVAEVMKFGHQRSHVRLCGFISGQEPVTASWRDADVVAAMEIALPDVSVQNGKPISQPVTIGGKVKAIVLPPISLSEYFNPDNSWSLYEVDSSGIRSFMYDTSKHKWVSSSAP